MSPIILARDVAYEFPNGAKLFSNLNFSLAATRTALVGPNGVGKTSLARLLSGEIEPTHGIVRRHGPVSLFAQRQDPPSMTVDEFLAGHGQWSRLRDKLLSQIDPRTPCTTLSGGQWTRVRLARALDEGFLILDEPTNDLDRHGREAVMQALSAHAGGALLISHDRECLNLCDEVWELSNVGLTKFGVEWSDYLQAKRLERERLAMALDRAKRARDEAHVNRIEQRARQAKRNNRGRELALRGGTPRIMLGDRKSRAQAFSGKRESALLEGAEAAISRAHEALTQVKEDPVMRAHLTGLALPAQKVIAEAHGFNVCRGRWIFADDLDFVWRGNVRVALHGPNGSGKSTLLQALMGAVFPVRGELKRGDLTTVYLDQRCGMLDEDASVFDNVRSVCSHSESDIRRDLARFLFAGDAVFRKVRHLSGGERIRAALARALLSIRKPELMLLDEPTNNLDLANIEFLESVLRDFGGALVVVSHDVQFLENCGVREELTLREGRQCRKSI